MPAMFVTPDAALNPRVETADVDIHESPVPIADAVEAVAVPRSHAWTWLAGAIVLTLLATAGAHRWWTYSRTHVTTDNAFVAGNIHQLSARVAGTVAEVMVTDNQRVLAGTALAKLDSRDFELTVEQAHNQVNQAAAQTAQVAAQLQQARAQLAQAEAKTAKAAAELRKAQLDYDRARHLTVGQGVRAE